MKRKLNVQVQIYKKQLSDGNINKFIKEHELFHWGNNCGQHVKSLFRKEHDSRLRDYPTTAPKSTPPTQPGHSTPLSWIQNQIRLVSTHV